MITEERYRNYTESERKSEWQSLVAKASDKIQLWIEENNIDHNTVFGHNNFGFLIIIDIESDDRILVVNMVDMSYYRRIVHTELNNDTGINLTEAVSAILESTLE
jgi:hypothetical protein